MEILGERMVMLGLLFYSFSLEQHVPTDKMRRLNHRFVDLILNRQTQIFP